jgi:Zn-dependent protease
MDSLEQNTLAIGMIWYVVFLFSTTCHEASHALAAKLGGDLTAFHGGQVTLNPIPHMRREPFGMAVVPILSFLLGGFMIGWASAPYDPAWQAQYPRRAAWMSLAGPGANFSLMLIAGILIYSGVALGFFEPPQSLNYTNITAVADPDSAGSLLRFAATCLSVFFFLNLVLGTFNLLPVPPLDGGTGVTLLMGERLGRAFLNLTSNPMFSLVGIILAWRIFPAILDPVFTMAIRILYPSVTYY